MRHRPSCKKCGSINSVKNGHNCCGTQRYKCKEGMGLNALCRVFKVSINSIQAWIKQEGKKFIQPDIKEEKFVSCDEMWTFVQKKKQKAWIWVCYSKMTKKILAVYIREIEENIQLKN